MNTTFSSNNDLMVVTAAWLQSLGAQCIGVNRDKSPTSTWSHRYDGEAASLQELALPEDQFAGAEGLAILNGLSNWRCVDIDGKSDGTTEDRDAVVDLLLRRLGLSQDYAWVVNSGSGRGAHIWIRCEGQRGSQSVQRWTPRGEYANMFHHIEFRLTSCYTIVPPSRHESGGEYRFRFGQPVAPPNFLDVNIIVDALAGIADNHSTVDSEVVDRVRSVKDSATFIRGEDKALEDLRSKLDLLGLVKAYLGTEHHEETGKEYRVGERGAGHGGWHVTKDNLKWNNFNDGSGEVGGDVFDFLGFRRFGDAWVRGNPSQFKQVIADARQAAGDQPGSVAQSVDQTPRKKLSTAESFQDWLKSKLQFRSNVLTETLEWTPLGNESWVRLQDRHTRSWLSQYEKETGIAVSHDRFRTYVDNDDFTVRFDPFKDYFDALIWDQQDHLGCLYATLKSDNEEWHRFIITKWLVATYACAYHGARTYRNEIFLIFTGSQGLGKTTFLRTLVPASLLEYKHEGIIDDGKDSILQRMRSIISINDEMSTLRRGDIEGLKARVSEDVFQIRRPYAVEPIQTERRVSYCGLLNDNEFLTDNTGNRRFQVVNVTDIDLNALRQVCVDQVWAQVKALFNSGQCLPYLTKEEQSWCQAFSEVYRVRTLEEDIMDRYFEPCSVDDVGAMRLTTSEVMEALIKKHDDENTSVDHRNGVPRLNRTPNSVRLVGALLKSKGFQKLSFRVPGSSPRHGWVLRYKPVAANTSVVPYPIQMSPR